MALLVERHGFDPSLVAAAGYSQYHPVQLNNTAQGRAANRRVDLVVVGQVPEKDKLARSGSVLPENNKPLSLDN